MITNLDDALLQEKIQDFRTFEKYKFSEGTSAAAHIATLFHLKIKTLFN